MFWTDILMFHRLIFNFHRHVPNIIKRHRPQRALLRLRADRLGVDLSLGDGKKYINVCYILEPSLRYSTSQSSQLSQQIARRRQTRHPTTLLQHHYFPWHWRYYHLARRTFHGTATATIGDWSHSGVRRVQRGVRRRANGRTTE